MFSIRALIKYLFTILLFASCSDEPGIIEPTQSFTTKSGVINEEIDGRPFVVFADESKAFFSAFSSELNGTKLVFEISDSAFPNKLRDHEGREWDVFGNGVSESNKGQKLETVDYLVGYWFFFPSFFDHIELQSGQNLISSRSATGDDSEWLINTGDLHYGSFRDGIRSIDQPKYLVGVGKNKVDNEFYSELSGDELVTVIATQDNKYKVYPHRILEYHEIVNDFESGVCSTISYCPLTGTSRLWEAKVDGLAAEFGVSGLLYNNNLILYDRETESHWSQVLNISVQGPQIGRRIANNSIYEMTYAEISKLDGEVLLLDPETGNLSSYNSSQYSDYSHNDHIFFPLAVQSDVIAPKERVLGVTISQVTKVYRYQDF